ncbi:ureidoglycolate lyase [Tistrella bauzanensis]|uniref:Ureidoglycolate lyase n=1 Tax=Tistrella bauzanensis TaxID=657419 RepID=A0ABQ1IMK1_9PROT|nr:ureidoglycolate lyase [Tistrella bauzanensis]GGB45679.1 ureidoglycolate lyase [Tistrella bauzanensis]
MHTFPRSILRPRRLTRADFLPFGDVIDAGDTGRTPIAINGGTCLRHDSLALVETDPAGHAALSLFFAHEPVSLPLVIEVMERHPLGSQAFMPLNRCRFIVVVGPAEDPRPRPENLQAFISDGRQGVSYRRGTWHLPLTVLDTGHLLVVDRKGPGCNLGEHVFEPGTGPLLLPQDL